MGFVVFFIALIASCLVQPAFAISVIPIPSLDVLQTNIPFPGEPAHSFSIQAGEVVDVVYIPHNIFLGGWDLSSTLGDNGDYSLLVTDSLIALSADTYTLNISGSTYGELASYDLGVFRAYFNPGVTDASRDFHSTKNTAKYASSGPKERNVYDLPDWYRFEVHQGDSVTVSLTPHTNSSSEMKLCLSELGVTSPFVCTNVSDDTTGTNSFTAQVTGTYYITVDGPTGSYDLSVNGPIIDDLNLDAYSSFINQPIMFSRNDLSASTSIETAQPIPFFDAWFRSDYEGEVDRYFSFDLQAGDGASLVIVPLTYSPNGLNYTVISVYPPSGKYPVAKESVLNDIGQVSFTAETAGTYYIKVEGGASLLDLGVFRAYFNPGVTEASRDFHSTHYTAKYASSGPKDRNVYGLSDWYRFEAHQGDSITVSLTPHSNSSSKMRFDILESDGVSWYDEIYNSVHKEVVNGATGTFSFTADTKTYYIAVSGPPGWYDLSVVGPPLSGISGISKYSSSAFNSAGAGSTAPTTNNPSFHADPVNVASGSHVLERNLISVSGVQPIGLTARYDSLLLAQGPMGKGWAHNFETNLEVLGNNDVRIHWTANRANTFINNGSNNFSATETAIKFDKIIKNDDSTYTLSRKDGSVYLFNTSGKLSQQKNRIGQQLNLAYDGNGRLATITEPISGALLTFSYTTAGLLNKVTDTLNRQVSFNYDASNNLATITDLNNKTTTYTYNADGRVLTAIDDEGNTIFTNTYDSQGRVATQDDALASTTQLAVFNYDETVQVGAVTTTVTDRTGATKVLTHDNNYNLIKIKDQLNAVTSHTYDADGNRLTSTDPNGNITGYTYDTRGNLLTITDPKGRVNIMTYDVNDNLLTATNSDGKKVTYTYDGNNRVTSIDNPFNQITSYTYNDNGQVATITDPQDGVTTYTYTNGLLATVADPAGNITSYAYDTAGRITSITNPAAKTTTMTYDGIGNLVSITDPLGHSSSITYDSHGNKLTTTDPKGNVTTYTYNGNSKLVSIKDALNQTTGFSYDPEDRLVKISDPLDHSNTIGYDAAGRPVTMTDALNNTATSVYDAVGNLTTSQDAYGATVLTTTYDSKTYTPLTVKDALLNTVTYGYDTLDRVTSVLDPLGRIHQNSYDDMNRLVSATDPNSGKASQTFDENGNHTTRKDPNNNQTLFNYDAVNRLIGINTASGGSTSISYANGLLASATNARNQTSTFSYYDDGRIETVTDPAGAITYTYDANGNVLTIVEGVKTLTYQYDALNRVTSYTDGDDNLIQYAYDAAGNLTTLTYPDGKAVTYTYDAANRLNTVTDWASRETSYSYDKNGRLMTTSRPDGSVETRTYDIAGQLIHLNDTQADTTTSINTYEYTYDAVGNVTAETTTGGDPTFNLATETMTYGTDNRLATYQGVAVSYDADGNMTYGPLDSGMKSFGYDARNRLTSVPATITKNLAGTHYYYDANNNRVGVMVNGQKTKYVVNPISTLSQVLMEKDGSGNVKAWYVYGLGLIGRQDATDNSYSSFHFDRRGSTVALTDLIGVITDTYSYTAFGELAGHTGAASQPFLYNGRDGVMSDDNGLYSMRARYYNPVVKRFVNMDSLLGGIEDGQTLNRFAYVGGNPVNMVDPFGLSADSDYINTGLDRAGFVMNMEGGMKDAFAYRGFDAGKINLNKNGQLTGIKLRPGGKSFAKGSMALDTTAVKVIGFTLAEGTELYQGGMNIKDAMHGNYRSALQQQTGQLFGFLGGMVGASVGATATAGVTIGTGGAGVVTAGLLIGGGTVTGSYLGNEFGQMVGGGLDDLIYTSAYFFND